MDKKIAIGQSSMVRVVWNVNTSDYTKEKEENIRQSFATKYGIPLPHISVEVNYVNKTQGGELSLNRDNVKNILDPKFQQELFKLCLKEKGIEDYDFDEILKIDSQINSLIDFDAYDKGRKYELKWLDWSNFLSYGENNHIDFTDFNGLILLSSVPANQGGKSTFAYDLLHFLFFGRTRSGKMDTLGDLFNRHTPEVTTLEVKGCICIDGVDYIIKRTLTRPSLKSKSKVRNVVQKVEYFRQLENGSLEELAEDGENLNEGNNIKTSKAIKEAIGNETDFDMVISANADNLKELISLKDTDRGKLLTRWIGLLPIEDKNIKAKEKWNREINVSRYSSRYNRETLKVEIESIKENIKEYEELITTGQKKVKESSKRIEDMNQTRETLLTSKRQIDPSLSNIDISTLEMSITNTTNEGVNKKKERELRVEELKQYENLNVFDEEAYKQLINEKECLISDISKIKVTIGSLKDTNRKLKESEYCPVCKRKFDNIDNSTTINENEGTIKKLTSEGIKKNERKIEIEKILGEMDTLRKVWVEKNKLELLITKIDVDLERLRNTLIEKRQIKKSIEDNKSAIEKNNEIETSLNIIKANIYSEEQIRTQNLQNISYYEKDIETAKAGILERESIITKIKQEEKEEQNWKLYLMLIGKDGISKMVLREALPLINSELRRLLDDVCDFSVEVRMDEKNDVDFIMKCKSDGVEQKLSAGSGFEQTAASLALRVVLGSMSALSKPPFLVLDEILGGVARDNYDNIKKLYDKIGKYYKFIFQICHVPLDWYDKTLTIVKDSNGISKISDKLY